MSSFEESEASSSGADESTEEEEEDGDDDVMALLNMARTRAAKPGTDRVTAVMESARELAPFHNEADVLALLEKAKARVAEIKETQANMDSSEQSQYVSSIMSSMRELESSQDEDDFEALLEKAKARIKRGTIIPTTAPPDIKEPDSSSSGASKKLNVEPKQSASSIETDEGEEEDDFVAVLEKADSSRAATFQATMRAEQSLMQDSFQGIGASLAEEQPSSSELSPAPRLTRSNSEEFIVASPTPRTQQFQRSGTVSGDFARGGAKTHDLLAGGSGSTSRPGSSSPTRQQPSYKKPLKDHSSRSRGATRTGSNPNLSDSPTRSGSNRSLRNSPARSGSNSSLRSIPSDRNDETTSGQTTKDLKHSSVSHLNYHARKNDEEDDDFDMGFPPPLTQKGSLDAHLFHQKGRDEPMSRISGTDTSMGSVDVTILLDDYDTKSKIGDLKVKPGTDATKAASSSAKDKSASTSLFPQRKPAVDQSVNLMDANAGQYESGSIGSSGRSSVSGSGRRMGAPSRPKKYASRPQRKDRVSTTFLGLISEAYVEDSTLTYQDDFSHAKKKQTYFCSWTTFIILVIIFAAGAAVILFVPSVSNVVGVGEASKSGVNLVDVLEVQGNDQDNFRDGTVMLPPHPVKISSGMTAELSELTQIVTSLQKKMSELQALIVKHRVSKTGDFDWAHFHDDYDQFKLMNPQTKALVWLAHQGTFHGEQEHDFQHHRLLQRYALAVLYYSTHGRHPPRLDAATIIDTANTDFFPSSFLYHMEHESSWFHSHHWLSKKSVCTWRGIGCDPEAAENEKIIALNLTHNGLCGTFPLREMTVSLGWSLRSIDLSGNHITGDLSLRELENETAISELVSWPHLRKLRMQDNQLGGNLPIDWMHTCKDIEEINLSGNAFVGTLPDHAFQYSENLRRIQLDHNQLAGRVPVIGHLEKLEHLEIQDNVFTGPFPTGVFMLTSLLELRAGDNLFSGTLSTDLANMINLEVLTVENNRLHGAVPDVFYTLPNMTQLSLRGNNFTGQLPESLAATERLEALALEGNSFSGTLSSSLSGLTNLKSLLLFNNHLTGKIPDEVCSLKEGFFNFKRLRHIAADCSLKVACSCCDECY
ncbi:LRR receptor-like serine threonine-protein kinase At4g08850-like [Seminavis robusta]|uniref:LRR receptor-like serine threonine-protein kinase At4g08850-like n=1 Tax=Seminavis robusta TaxID=568900 RepID=A0A9N8DLI0_9STRA|nr:LRR receptor-like serine threonine-protein kinase At4g08850-like [Seminavis robusta]|eukprot:Sro225_g091820.1 LRR receptor-like serine threonine-protein kinase At4g08850-like (1102) ;mRNA; f:43681-47389